MNFKIENFMGKWGEGSCVFESPKAKGLALFNSTQAMSSDQPVCNLFAIAHDFTNEMALCSTYANRG